MLLFPEHTEKLGRNPKVGCNHFQGYSLNELRIALNKVAISPGGIFCEVTGHPELLSDICVLRHDAEKFLEDRHFMVKPVEVIFMQFPNPAVIKCLNAHNGGFIKYKAVHVCDPPVVRSKHHGAVVSFSVDAERTQQPRLHITDTVAGMSFGEFCANTLIRSIDVKSAMSFWVNVTRF